jgi:hypothetical protein
MKKKLKMSLALAVAILTAVTIAVAMGLYAVIQYYTMPDYTVIGLIAEHGWHVVVLGIFSYIVFYAVFYYMVVRPVTKIYLKCYSITKGNYSKLELKSKIKEIQDVADGINMIIWRYEKDKEENIKDVQLTEDENSSSQINE